MIQTLKDSGWPTAECHRGAVRNKTYFLSDFRLLLLLNVYRKIVIVMGLSEPTAPELSG